MLATGTYVVKYFFADLFLVRSNAHNFLQKLFFYRDIASRFAYLYEYPTVLRLAFTTAVPYEALCAVGSLTKHQDKLRFNSFSSGYPTIALAKVGLKDWRQLPGMFRNFEISISVRLSTIQTLYSSFKIEPSIY